MFELSDEKKKEYKKIIDDALMNKCEFCNTKDTDKYTNYSQCCVCSGIYQFCITCLNTRTVTFCKTCMREFLISEIEHK